MLTTVPTRSAAPGAGVVSLVGTTAALSDTAPVYSLSGHKGAIRSIRCGVHWLATCGGSDTLIWVDEDAKEGRTADAAPTGGAGLRNVERLALGDVATSMALSCEETMVFHAFASGKVTAYDVETATQLTTVTPGVSSIANAAAQHTSTNDIFATASDDGKLRVFDLRAFKPLVASCTFADPLTAVTFLPSGDVACAGTDGIVSRLASATTKPMVRVEAGQDVVSQLVPYAVGDGVDVITMDGLISRVDLAPVQTEDSRLSNFRECPANVSKQLFQVARCRGGALSVPHGTGVVTVGTDGSSDADAQRHAATVTAAEWMLSRECLVTGADDGTIVLG